MWWSDKVIELRIGWAEGFWLRTMICVLSVFFSFSAIGCGGGSSAAPGPPPPAPQTTYTNPLSVTDSATGPVTSCPDPSILKVFLNGTNAWYLYCTGDALNSNDRMNGNLKGHLINIFRSSDLIHWTYLHDAFATLPAWIGPSNSLWAPDIQFFNGQYYLYYTVPPGAAGPNNGSAIGVATSSDPAGPFLDKGSALIPPEPAANCCGGAQRWIFDSNITSDDNGQKYIIFGSYLGGVSVRMLSSDGMSASAASETLIALENRYEGSFYFRKNGYYYLFVSSGNCCNQALTGYSMWVGRSQSPLGPFLDKFGNSFAAARTGGTPVILMNGNSFVGPGGGVVFTHEAGQDYPLYHAVALAAPVFAGTNSTARPVLLDPLDWGADGWPAARGGFGPSDVHSPQAMPAAQPGQANAHVAAFAANDMPSQAIPELSDDLKAPALNLQTQWPFLHSAPAYSMTGSAYEVSTVNFDMLNAPAQVPLLAEATPAGNYMVEVKMKINLPASGSGMDFAQGGVMIYRSDQSYLKLDVFANSNTRQIEFFKQIENPPAGQANYGSIPLGPPADYTELRIAKRTVSGQDQYTAYSSQDGTEWVRGGTWTASLGANPQIVLFAQNRSGFLVGFSYVHVSTLP